MARKKSKTTRLLQQMRSKPEPRTPIATDMYIPNHSGIASHPEATGTYLKLDGTNSPITGDIEILGANLTLTRSGGINGDFLFDGGNFKSTQPFDVYPNNQTSIGLRVTEDSTNLQLQGLGTNTVEFLDNVTLVMNDPINMSSNLINNVTDPVSAQDAATKNYVDTKTIAHSSLTNLNWSSAGHTFDATLDTGAYNIQNNGFTLETDGDIKGKAAGAIILYPDNQATIGLSINEDGTNLELSAVGSSLIEIDDAVKIQGNLTIGNGAAGTDYTITVDGETNDGVITWMEDEDYFSFADDIMIPSGEKIYFATTDSYIASANNTITFTTALIEGGEVVFDSTARMGSSNALRFRDSGIYLNSNQDGKLSIIADNIVEVGSSGDLDIQCDTYFTGAGTGLPYGSCYGNEIAWSQASAVQNTWYDISDADMADGELNLTTHDGNGQLTVSAAGVYSADAAISCEANAANVHVQIAFSVNGTEAAPLAHIETAAANRQENASITALLNLAASDTVEVSIRTTDAGTPNLTVDHLMLKLVQVGG